MTQAAQRTKLAPNSTNYFRRNARNDVSQTLKPFDPALGPEVGFHWLTSVWAYWIPTERLEYLPLAAPGGVDYQPTGLATDSWGWRVADAASVPILPVGAVAPAIP